MLILSRAAIYSWQAWISLTETDRDIGDVAGPAVAASAPATALPAHQQRRPARHLFAAKCRAWIRRAGATAARTCWQVLGLRASASAARVIRAAVRRRRRDEDRRRCWSLWTRHQPVTARSCSTAGVRYVRVAGAVFRLATRYRGRRAEAAAQMLALLALSCQVERDGRQAARGGFAALADRANLHSSSNRPTSPVDPRAQQQTRSHAPVAARHQACPLRLALVFWRRARAVPLVVAASAGEPQRRRRRCRCQLRTPSSASCAASDLRDAAASQRADMVDVVENVTLAWWTC